MKNVVGYIRVSTDGQCGDDKYGLDVQRQMVSEYCKSHDMNIFRWYMDEGESGAKERPGFDEIAYGEVQNPPVEAVVVAKSDRVARDINIYFYYKMLLIKKDIKLISVSEDFGQMGVMAPMLEAFVMAVAQMERDNITKRTSSGRKAKAKTGGYSGGRAPMGYMIKDGEYVINEDEAAVVRRIFELRDSGETLFGIVDKLTEEGYKTRSGKDFASSTVQSIINNRKTYLGYYHYGKDGDWVKGRHEPILKEE